MTIYITQGRYTRDAIIGMIDKPEDRTKAVAALAAAAGAKLLSYYVTFGDYDFLVIMEGGRDPTKTMAALMTVAATGGVTDLKTTVAVSSQDAVKAMRAAKKMVKGFKAAGRKA